MADDNSIWAREQALAIVVDLRGQFGTGTDTSWKTPGYINGNSTGSGRSYWADGVQSSNPQSLINALAAISSSTTKTTKIEMKWEIPGSSFSGGPRGGSTSEFSTYSTMSVFIDWENMTVTWSGQGNSGISTYATLGGKKTISSAGSTVKLDLVPGQNGDGHYRCRDCPEHSQIMVLKTGTNRNITGLPAPIHDRTVSAGGFSSGFTMHGNYMVTTDNGMTVSVAPDAPPVAADVSGIKISELNAATSLNDTDLFVLSRDQPAGAPYDKSLNITKTDLIASVYQEIAPGIPAPIMLSAPSTLRNSNWLMPATAYNVTTYNVPSGAKFAILECYWSVTGYNHLGVSYIKMGHTSAVPYILGAAWAAGGGDAVAGANQGLCPIEDDKIYLKVTLDIQGSIVVRIIGYYT